MTERREPRERPDRLASRNHTDTPHDHAHNGDQPLPLDKRSSIWATLRSSDLGVGRAVTRFRFRRLGRLIRALAFNGKQASVIWPR